jgi:hypothetical protein
LGPASHVRAKFVGFHGTPALKRDLWKIARVEDRSLSTSVCALLRLGISRYFELAGDTVETARLRAKLQELIAGDGATFTSMARRNDRSECWKPSRVTERQAYAAEFDKAVESGNREFAANYGEGSHRDP